MRRTASARQRLTLMVLAAGIVAVGFLGIYFREAIREEWQFLRIVRVIRTCCPPETSLPEGPIFNDEEEAELLDLSRWFAAEGARAYPLARRLLRHPEYRVWCQMAGILDSVPGREALIDHLRAQDQVALLRYLIHPAYQHGTDWRSWQFGWHSWHGYWSGDDEKRLVLGREALSCIENLLAGRIEYSGTPEYYGDLQERSLEALGAALYPGELPAWPPYPAGEDASQQIFRMLLAAAREHIDPEVRLKAVEVLMRCKGLQPEKWGYREVDTSVFTELRPPNREWLTAIALVDHPRSLERLITLDRDPAARQAVREVLQARESPLPLPFPEWLPFEAAARRFLDETPRSRALAAFQLARLGRPESVPILEALIAGCRDPEEAALYQACLAALGDKRGAPEPIARLEKLLAERQALAKKYGNIIAMEIEEPFAEGTRYPCSFTLSVDDLATLLLWGGRRDVLERIVEHQIHHGMLCLALSDHIEAPAGEDDSAAALELDGDLESWWSEHRAAITWDPQSRKFRPGKIEEGR